MGSAYPIREDSGHTRMVHEISFQYNGAAAIIAKDNVGTCPGLWRIRAAFKGASPGGKKVSSSALQGLMILCLPLEWDL